jgi:hypothetical protein
VLIKERPSRLGALRSVLRMGKQSKGARGRASIPVRWALAEETVVVGRGVLAPGVIGVVACLLRQQRGIVVSEVDHAVVVGRLVRAGW